MGPLEWLRAKAKQKPKMAVGGLVAAPTPDDPLILPSGCLWPIDINGDIPITRPALPPGTTIRMRGDTETTDEERQQFLDAVQALMGRPRPGPARREQIARNTEARAATVFATEDRLECPCAVIYSRCYYPVTHAGRRR